MCVLNNISLEDIRRKVRPLHVILFFYILGILLGRFIQVESILWFSILTALFLLSVISYYKQWRITSIIFITIFLIIGILNVNYHIKPPKNQHIANFVSDNRITVIGTVLDKQKYPNSGKLSLKILADHIENHQKNLKTRGLFLLNIFHLEKDFEYGDVIRMTGQLKKPEKSGNFGDFNYELYLAQKNIYTVMNIWTKRDIELIGQENINPCIKFSHLTRDRIKEVIANTFPEPYHGLMIGLMLGEKSLVSEELKEIFIDSGVMHILAVSGLHVGIISGFLLFLLGMLRIPKNIKYAVVLFLLAFYMTVTGFRSSVIRATIMFSILIIGRMINRYGNSFNSLFFAAFIILMINPLILYDSGFLLSFFVTFSIIYLVPVITSIFSTGLKWFDNGLSISIAAWIGLFPLSAYFFNKVSIIAIIANLFIVPLASVAVLLGFITFFMGFISIQFASFTASIGYLFLRLMVSLVDAFSSIPFSFIHIGQPSIIGVILYYLSFIIIVEILFKKKYSLRINGKTIILALMMIVVIVSMHLFFPKDEIEVHYLNVGEGDCAFIQFPNNRNILIDGGGSPGSEFDVGEKIVMPYLRRKGIQKIDVMILSHPHLDHLEGLLPILREFDTRLVMDNRIECDIPEYNEFISLIEKKKIPYHHTVAGEHFKIDKFTEMIILNPGDNNKKIFDDNDFNNNSIVLKLCYKESSFLFTGDIEEEAEQSLMSWKGILASDILKVAHHGSDTSTHKAFLKVVNPVIAVISTGKNNFGHPSDAVIQRLEKNGTSIFRTDKDGTIIIKTDGIDYAIKTSGR